MSNKLRIPYISDTILIGNTYIVERRDHSERRCNSKKKVRYERRKQRDPRLPTAKSIDITI